MTPEQLDEIEKLRLAATGGKWQHQRWPCQIWEGNGPEAEMCAAIGPLYAKAEQPNREQVYADSKFMEAMSEYALPLVKALREAWKERDESRAEGERLKAELKEVREKNGSLAARIEKTDSELRDAWKAEDWLRSVLRLLWEEAQDKAAIRDDTTEAVEAALKEEE